MVKILRGGSILDINNNYKVNDARDSYGYKCNSNFISSTGNDSNNGIYSTTGTQAYDAFNAIYNVYYQNVIKTNNGGATITQGLNNPIPNTHCTGQYCPYNGNPGDTNEGNMNYFQRATDSTGKIMTYSDLKPYLEDCARNLPTLQTNEPNTYTKYSNLDASYNLLTQHRNDLDIKMQEILATRGSLVNENQNYIDGSVYTTLLWTVLATSLIYYTFTKM